MVPFCRHGPVRLVRLAFNFCPSMCTVRLSVMDSVGGIAFPRIAQTIPEPARGLGRPIAFALSPIKSSNQPSNIPGINTPMINYVPFINPSQSVLPLCLEEGPPLYVVLALYPAAASSPPPPHRRFLPTADRAQNIYICLPPTSGARNWDVGVTQVCAAAGDGSLARDVLRWMKMEGFKASEQAFMLAIKACCSAPVQASSPTGSFRDPFPPQTQSMPSLSRLPLVAASEERLGRSRRRSSEATAPLPLGKPGTTAEGDSMRTEGDGESAVPGAFSGAGDSGGPALQKEEERGADLIYGEGDSETAIGQSINITGDDRGSREEAEDTYEWFAVPGGRAYPPPLDDEEEEEAAYGGSESGGVDGARGGWDDRDSIDGVPPQTGERLATTPGAGGGVREMSRESAGDDNVEQPPPSNFDYLVATAMRKRKERMASTLSDESSKEVGGTGGRGGISDGGSQSGSDPGSAVDVSGAAGSGGSGWVAGGTGVDAGSLGVTRPEASTGAGGGGGNERSATRESNIGSDGSSRGDARGNIESGDQQGYRGAVADNDVAAVPAAPITSEISTGIAGGGAIDDGGIEEGGVIHSGERRQHVDWERAWALLLDMEAAEHLPSPPAEAFNTVLGACVAAGRVGEALEITQAMAGAGHTPDSSLVSRLTGNHFDVLEREAREAEEAAAAPTEDWGAERI